MSDSGSAATPRAWDDPRWDVPAASLSEAVAEDCRTMELEGRYGWSLARQIAKRERFLLTQADADSLREWAKPRRVSGASRSV